MSTSASDRSRAREQATLDAAKFAALAIKIGIMGLILGVGAVLVTSIAYLLAAMVLVEAAGTFYFAKRASAEGASARSLSQARAARGLAILAAVLAAFGVVNASL